MIAHSCGFVNVPTEKNCGLFFFYPGAECRAAGVLAGSVFVELGVVRREMHDEMKLGDAIERREGGGDFGFGIFAGSFERRDVAVAEAGPVRIADVAALTVKIDETEFSAKFLDLLVSLMISGKDQQAFA